MAALFRLKVKAGGKRDSIASTGPYSFAVEVRTEAKEGNANLAALALLSAHLGVAAKRLRIVKGAKAPNKIVALLGNNPSS